MEKEPRWQVDKETAIAMNQIADELGIDSSQVKEIVSSYYFNVKNAIISDEMPVINILKIGSFKPVPKFIKLAIHKNATINGEAAKQEVIRLQTVKDRLAEEKKLNKRLKKRS
jgi:nucleoid DNA-binding protein